MPVKKDPNGQRSVQAEVEVPGTPEQVWAAIATGPGISAWFVPSTCDERVGGNTTCNFGPGMESVATITQWNPPHNFSAESTEGPGPVATEWTVEARDNGVCVVRVVHRWFSNTDDWDNQFEGHAHGWQAFFRILNLYLGHFAGQPSAAVQHAIFTSQPVPEIWRSVMSALGIDNTSETVVPAPAAPKLGGQVKRRGTVDHPELLLQLTEPAPGIAHLFAMPLGPQTIVSIRLYLYGDDAATAASQAQEAWTAWTAEKFPAG